MTLLIFSKLLIGTVGCIAAMSNKFPNNAMTSLLHFQPREIRDDDKCKWSSPYPPLPPLPASRPPLPPPRNIFLSLLLEIRDAVL